MEHEEWTKHLESVSTFEMNYYGLFDVASPLIEELEKHLDKFKGIRCCIVTAHRVIGSTYDAEDACLKVDLYEFITTKIGGSNEKD